ncbi:FxsA family protein [Aestuariibacter sp. A3R04]|uniref:FxsA family protein n=1 Tax=Aestuariibacter sp. A3R04 TaxID=2841571 RepID=UPI001C080522|nr:FxsA family protein [Aestuariibacter sp. A3R04]MBU3020394.1 FxsA family protein [Aestuariibacter sp. A3R04]
MRILFLLFAIMPIIEIALLVKVGGIIGGWNTIGIVLLTAFIGAYFVRREGVSTLQTAQAKMQRGEMPGKELIDGLMLAVAGVLMVTPGFVTDIFGILLVMPGTRHGIAAFVTKHMKMRAVTTATFHQQGFGQHSPFDGGREPKHARGDVFEGQYTDKSSDGESRQLNERD